MVFGWQSNGSPYAMGPLSCLSATLVYSGQTVGWIKTPLGMEVGLGPGDTALDGDPAPTTERGIAAPSPSFWPMSIVAKRLRAHLSNCWALVYSSDEEWTWKDYYLPKLALCKGQHLALNIPEIHEAVHIGCNSFESWHSNGGTHLLKSLLRNVIAVSKQQWNMLQSLQLFPSVNSFVLIITFLTMFSTDTLPQFQHFSYFFRRFL